MNVILQGGPKCWGQGVEFVDSHEVRPDHGESMGVVAITHSEEGMMHVHYKLQDVGKLCELCFIMLPQPRDPISYLPFVASCHHLHHKLFKLIR
jgi:hypothetical protein